MFKMLAERKRRRVWSPLTVGASVVAHLILLDLALGLSTGEAAEQVVVADTIIWDVPDDRPPPPPPAPPAPVDRSEPPATLGATRQIDQPPMDPPAQIPPIDLAARPVDPREFSGIGPIGDSIGKPAVVPTPPTGGSGPPAPPAPFTADMVEELPRLSNESEAQRALRRSYPHILRESGVEGRAIVQAIIDENGVVEPGSVTVISSTHEAFGEAAIKAVERFRFRPAKIQGRPVPVMISLPVDWKLES